MLIENSHLVLDACCILNFCASGNFLSILKTIPAQVVVTEVVKARELLTLKKVENQENEGAIQLEMAIEQELLLVVDFESESEEETYINYVFELGDDGESATCAIAVHRGWAIATDDRKAIAFCQKEALNLPIFSTLEIIKYWSEATNLDSDKLRLVLEAIQIKGRYRPHKNHLLFSWWEAAINP